MDNRRNIFDVSFQKLEEELVRQKLPAFRSRQIYQGIYQNLWDGFEKFTNLPASLRESLTTQYNCRPLSPVSNLFSSDRQTQKILFQLPDDSFIETVLMRYEERNTLCISTQVGCAVGCVFCATGQMGYKRNLSSGEIIEQVLIFARQLKSEGQNVTNIVVMGMGEPFLNYDPVLEAIDRLNDPIGFGMGERRFTISTVGIVPAIKKFAREQRQINLAISLHAASDELRSSLLPINNKYPLGELIPACKEYMDLTHRRVTFEWALISGVNDGLDQAKLLCDYLRSSLSHVNVIPLNPTTKYPGMPTSRENAERFREVLQNAGISCTIRLRRGIDIQAGCGQLASRAHLS